MIELAFVLAPGQNLFFVELVDALRDELHALGVASSVHEGRFPAPEPDRVHVLVPPHEYFTLTHGQPGVPERALARTIFVCAEQPGTRWFAENVALASRCGALFDINRLAVRSFAREGISAQHLQIGATPRWNRSRPDAERDIDVLFLGAVSPRRSRALATAASSLSRRRLHLVLSDGAHPNADAAPTFVAGEAKLDLLSRSRVVLNVHQGAEPYFEWLRAVQAIQCGCAIVSEHAVDYEPLRPGEDFAPGGWRSLGLLADRLLEDDERRAAMVAAATGRLAHRLPLATAARSLAERAEELAALPLPSPADPHYARPVSRPPRPAAARRPDGPQDATDNLNVSTLRRGLKDVRLDLLDLRRALARLGRRLTDGADPAAVEVATASPAWTAAQPRVSVLVSLFDYGRFVGDALDSVDASAFGDWELVVVDDGSADDSAATVLAWLEAHPWRPALLVRHPLNRGLPHARNTALAFARGELSFVLDADNEILSHGLGRLVEALDGDPGAAFAYGMFERFDASGPLELGNVWPWEPWRLRTGNFVDAMALLRTDVLREAGGYDTDRRLYGWEDFDLWCRLAEAGRRGAFVPEVVARYRSTGHSMISLTDLSVTEAFSIVIERCPRLMAGVRPPL